MRLSRSIGETRKTVTDWRASGMTVGFVPTMGAFHPGHVYLMRCSREQCDRTVVSIFVNPLQFGPNEDLDAYPRQLEADLEIARREGVDLVFAPPVEEMYPRPQQTKVVVEGPSRGLCGDFRPGHFEGVATVVAKLFNIVPADRAYFGQKDAQQLAVVETMVADLAFPIEVVRCPTVREPDGLAMSSRNKYLGPDSRRAARCLSRGLERAALLAEAGERRVDRLERAVREEIEAEPKAHLEYAELRDASTIAEVDSLEPGGRYLLAVAARIDTEDASGNSPSTARLIDNYVLQVSGSGDSIVVDRGMTVDDDGRFVPYVPSYGRERSEGSMPVPTERSEGAERPEGARPVPTQDMAR